MTVSPETLAGVIGGAANIVSGFPFDTVKVKLQHASPGTYKSSLDCCRHILGSQGVRGLYRGMSVPLIGGSLECGVNYGVFYGTNKYLQGSKQGKDMDLSGLILSGMVSGTALSVILGPVELIKCRIQAGAPTGHMPYTGPIDVVKRIIQNEGRSGIGIWRGLGATLLREVPGNTIFFVIYEGMRSFVLPREQLRSSAQLEDGEDLSSLSGARKVAEQAGGAIVSGGVAGAVFWSSVLPVDGAKTRIQAALPGSPNDISVWQHLTKTYSQAGIRGLYAGILPTVVRAFPANACQWLAYELALQALSSH